ncbi:MAG: hypothetical protein ABIP20_14020 [Chthoniobacteraceae bacterium]
MNFIVSLLATVILFLTASLSQAKPAPKPFDFEGDITAITATSVTVKGQKGTRTFAIYPGTVFGQRAKATFADFKAGEHVIVVFSEGGGQTKAENLRNPADDKVKGAKKAAKNK